MTLEGALLLQHGYVDEHVRSLGGDARPANVNVWLRLIDGCQRHAREFPPARHTVCSHPAQTAERPPPVPNRDSFGSTAHTGAGVDETRGQS